MTTPAQHARDWAEDHGMKPLIPVWEIDTNTDDIDPGVFEAAEFLNKMDSEGGLLSYLHWGGVDRFPDALRDQAQVFADAEYELRAAIDSWAAERGVQS